MLSSMAAVVDDRCEGNSDTLPPTPMSKEAESCSSARAGNMLGEHLKDLELPFGTPELQALAKKLGITSRREMHLLEEEVKLRYHFGGLDVACKSTPEGRFVVASGPPHEVAQVLERLTAAEQRQITLFFPDRWD